MPDHWHTQSFALDQILEHDSVEDLLSRWQIGEIDASREIASYQRCRAYHTLRILERIGGGVLDDHTTGAVCTAPDDGGVTGRVAAGDTVRDGRTLGVGCDKGWGTSLRESLVHRPVGRQGTGPCDRQQREKGSTADKRLFSHGISSNGRL
jgi:hypothetical protein